MEGDGNPPTPTPEAVALRGVKVPPLDKEGEEDTVGVPVGALDTVTEGVGGVEGEGDLETMEERVEVGEGMGVREAMGELEDEGVGDWVPVGAPKVRVP